MIDEATRRAVRSMLATLADDGDHDRPRGSPVLSGEAFERAVAALEAELDLKVERQGGTHTFGDGLLLYLIDQLVHLDRDRSWEAHPAGGEVDGLELRPHFHRLRELLTLRSRGRFVSFEERQSDGPGGRSEIPPLAMMMSQGATECMQWKGRSLFKTAFDTNLYSMLLWDLKPRTIIEIGSGEGASAVWFADMLGMLGVECRIYSVDRRRPDLVDDRVTFVAGDCTRIEGMFDEAWLRAASHPWLVIEDAHVNVPGVLRYFHRHLERGDYLVVEDSHMKQRDLAEFSSHLGAYLVDTYYTDFFGRNATCARDSILVRA